MAGRLEGKVAVVSGAGSVGPGWGNGRSTAVFFAREGARVLASDINPEGLEETLAMIEEDGNEVTPFTADATDSEQVAGMIQAAKDTYGRVDILVNMVGGSSHGGAAELTEEAWAKQLDYNLTSVFLGCRHVIPVMREQGGGSIVNIASASGVRFTGAPQVAYAASKAGVIQLSRVTAVQYAPDGIRVNSVVPGQVHTPLVEARLANQRAGGDLEKLLAQRQARIPLGWMGDGRDIANAALFLASDQARFVTGTEIVVDGGMTARCD
ncbi:MAG: SDR family oxidoreductase [Propionibacteriales bacterium]|nr:SDR family oxidoreductase [Propionibacteriales bacterium]